MAEPNCLTIECLSPAQLQRCPHGWWEDVLACVCYDGEVIEPPVGGIPRPDVNTAVLGPGEERAEVWRLAGPLSSGQLGRVHYRRAEQLLFAALQVHEREFPAAANAAERLRTATVAAYRELFQALEALGFAHPLRFWNYVPDINADNAGAERYWHFNGARRSAFLDARRNIAGNVPAASALGAARDSALTVYCLAGREPPISLENPRQCSAWQYPRQYGPLPPTFARACLDPTLGQTLYISGTASIVGHRSEHPGDTLAQTRETLSNIQALVATANEHLGRARHAAARLCYKIYLRHPHDQLPVERELRLALGENVPMLFLHADICRRELAVEIEAVGL